MRAPAAVLPGGHKARSMFGCDHFVSQAGQVEAVRKLVPLDGATCRKAAAACEPEDPCVRRVVVLE